MVDDDIVAASLSFTKSKQRGVSHGGTKGHGK